MVDSDFQQTTEPLRPHLWNPTAAAAWSLLLSPAFGAYLCAANWRTLGKPERATANMVWVWVIIVFLAINVGRVFVPVSEAVGTVMTLTSCGLILGWLVTQVRSQVRFVKTTLGNDYVKKRWGRPLLVGFAAVGVYVAVIFFAAVGTYTPKANDLAAQVKPLILQKWQKKPALRDASIENVSLVHQGGKVYTGLVNATLSGQSVQLSLQVVYSRGTIAFTVKPLASR